MSIGLKTQSSFREKRLWVSLSWFIFGEKVLWFLDFENSNIQKTLYFNTRRIEMILSRQNLANWWKLLISARMCLFGRLDRKGRRCQGVSHCQCTACAWCLTIKIKKNLTSSAGVYTKCRETRMVIRFLWIVNSLMLELSICFGKGTLHVMYMRFISPGGAFRQDQSNKAHRITWQVPAAVRVEFFLGKIFNEARLSCASVGQSQCVIVAVQHQLNHITFLPQLFSFLDFLLDLHISIVSVPAVRSVVVIIGSSQPWLGCNTDVMIRTTITLYI